MITKNIAISITESGTGLPEGKIPLAATLKSTDFGDVLLTVTNELGVRIAIEDIEEAVSEVHEFIEANPRSTKKIQTVTQAVDAPMELAPVAFIDPDSNYNTGKSDNTPIAPKKLKKAVIE